MKTHSIPRSCLEQSAFDGHTCEIKLTGVEKQCSETGDWVMGAGGMNSGRAPASIIDMGNDRYDAVAAPLRPTVDQPGQ